jgi:hypothetical protein
VFADQKQLNAFGLFVLHCLLKFTGGTMSEQIDENTSKGVPSWVLAGGFVGIAAVITALSGPIMIVLDPIVHPDKNVPPKAVITVDQPQSSSTNNLYEIVAGTPLKLNPYSSDDDEDGGNLTYSWLLDGKEESTLPVFSAILPKRDEVYNIALTVTDRRGAKGTSSIRVQVINASVSNASQPIPTQSGEDVSADAASTSSSLEQIDSEKQDIRNYFEWVHTVEGSMPGDALVAGLEYSVELQGNQPLYLCRGDHAGRKIPGKVVTGKCNIPTYEIVDGNVKNRNEQLLSRYEVLIPKASLAWVDHEKVPVDDSGLPRNAVFADGRYKSLICRAFYEQDGNSGYHPGILDFDTDLCIFPWGGTAGYLRDYEVLVVNQ